MSLSGSQRRELQDALIDAFPDTASLERMLAYELDRNLRAIAGEGSLQDIVFKLIQTANSQGWVEDLVRAARNSNPGNPRLKIIAEGLPPEAISKITRQQFLKWAGLGSVGSIAAVVTHEIFKAREQSFKFEVLTINDERGKIIERRPGQAKFLTEDLGNGVTLEMVRVPAGSFKMGSPPEEEGRKKNEEPQHTVKIPAFFMGRFEVTQEQYQQVMDKNPADFKGVKRPVENVSWNDAMEFCKKLSQKTGRKYRLPSEAEWEYACRAETTTPFHFGETITTDLANYQGTDNKEAQRSGSYGQGSKGEYRKQTTPVGIFSPNAFGLSDMHGNVWEWCADTWHENYQGAPDDGIPWIDNDNLLRVLRGGSWYFNPDRCRSAYRGMLNPDVDYSNNGFRVVL